MEKEEKRKPRLKSKFSMGELDFIRFDKMLTQADELAHQTRVKDSESLAPYYSILKQIYINFRPIIFQTQRKKFDECFERAEQQIETWRAQRGWRRADKDLPFGNEIGKLLERLHIELLDIKQITGLGIAVTKEVAEKLKMKRVMGV